MRARQTVVLTSRLFSSILNWSDLTFNIVEGKRQVWKASKVVFFVLGADAHSSCDNSTTSKRPVKLRSVHIWGCLLASANAGSTENAFDPGHVVQSPSLFLGAALDKRNHGKITIGK